MHTLYKTDQLVSNPNIVCAISIIRTSNLYDVYTLTSQISIFSHLLCIKFSKNICMHTKGLEESTLCMPA